MQISVKLMMKKQEDFQRLLMLMMRRSKLSVNKPFDRYKLDTVIPLGIIT